jgi:hypothetical protein
VRYGIRYRARAPGDLSTRVQTFKALSFDLAWPMRLGPRNEERFWRRGYSSEMEPAAAEIDPQQSTRPAGTLGNAVGTLGALLIGRLRNRRAGLLASMGALQLRGATCRTDRAVRRLPPLALSARLPVHLGASRSDHLCHLRELAAYSGSSGRCVGGCHRRLASCVHTPKTTALTRLTNDRFSTSATKARRGLMAG